MFHGWYVVGAAFLVATWSWGLSFYALGIYLVALGRAHGWSISSISLAITVYYLVGAGLTASAGDLMRRLGHHRAIALGTLAMAASVVSLASLRELWQLYVALLAMAVGWACLGAAAINVLLAPWFVRRRGVAVSLALTGASAGGVVVAPALLFLIARVGFSRALWITAGALVATLLPVALLVLRHTPASLGVGPDGDPAARPGADGTGADPVPRRAAALRTRHYWSTSVAFALALAAQVGVITHLVSHLAPTFGDAGAAWLLGLTTTAAIAGRLPMGALADRMDRRRIAGLNFLVQMVGIALLALPWAPALYAGCVLFGLGVGNAITLPGLLVEREFPRELFASLVSLLTATNQLAFAFAPALLGALRDWTGDYRAALVLCAGAELAAAAVVMLGRPRRGSAATARAPGPERALRGATGSRGAPV